MAFPSSGLVYYNALGALTPDSVGRIALAQNSGGNPVTFAAGKHGNAAFLADHVDSGLVSSPFPVLHGAHGSGATTTLSISLWLYTNGKGGRIVLGQEAAAVTFTWSIEWTTTADTIDQLNWYGFASEPLSILQADSFAVDADTWTHICLRWDLAQELYSCKVNGVEQADAGPQLFGLDTPASPQSLWIGAHGGAAFAGSGFDELAIWNRYLTDQEVTDLYAAGAGLFYTDPTPARLRRLLRP